MANEWMIYGANGYTGRLIAEYAVENGHAPLLAGRSEEKIRPIAEQLGLDYVVAPLDRPDLLEPAVSRCELVLHAAGPFIYTARPMMEACIKGEAHYLDITGEIDVFEMAFSLSDRAKAAGIVLLPGVGFDVIPTDCLAKYVSEKVPNAQDLEIAFSAISSLSPGTTKTSIEGMGNGGLIRRDGELIPLPIGDNAQKIQFSHKPLWTMPIPWGDIATAYRSTGIPNITTYLAMPKSQINQIKRFRGLMGVLGVGPIKSLLKWIVERRIEGPDADARAAGKSYIWAKATDSTGQSAEAWLETAEGYQLTVWGSLASVELVLDGNYSGATTPSLAFGADFVMQFPGSKRFDTLS